MFKVIMWDLGCVNVCHSSLEISSYFHIPPLHCLFQFQAAMKPMNPKKRWLAESSQDEPPDDVDANANGAGDDDIAEDDEAEVSEGVGRLTIDLERQASAGQLATSETPPQPRIDLGRLQPGQNALITSETLISRVVSVVPVSEASSSAGSSPFR